MTKQNPIDIDRIAEIIVCNIKNLGEDNFVKYILDRLIRKWSDSYVPSHKSKEVVKLEKEYGISLLGISRKQVYNKNKDISKLIVIEHGLPESQAIEMCFKEPDTEKVKIILKDLLKNLTYITKIEHNGLGKEWRVIGEKGYYWEDAYSKNGIIPESNLK